MEVPPAQHFIDQRHIADQFKFVVLDKIEQCNDERVDVNRSWLQQKTFWIFRLGLLALQGLDMSIDYSVFL